MPELTTEERERLDRGDFAYVDRDGGEHLPIHDREHARNAVSRWNQTHFESAEAREAVAQEDPGLVAKRFGIQLSDDDEIMKGSC